ESEQITTNGSLEIYADVERNRRSGRWRDDHIGYILLIWL
ncbi:hypothetical protein MTO96_051165, partial [Rhipicephalus appendiculatus]